MIKLRTLKQAAELIRAYDPETALNENFLRTLAAENRISHDTRGNRTLVDIRLLSMELWRVAGVAGVHDNRRIPKFRSARDAAELIRQADPESAVTEELIRAWASEGRLHSVTCGAKQLVLMEDFLFPNVTIFRGTAAEQVTETPKKPRTEKVAACEQFDRILQNAAQPYRCRREAI